VRVNLDPADPARYRTPEGWEKLVRHAEIIEVDGKPAETLLVDETRWGPIMARDVDGTPLALAWTAHRARVVNLELLQLETRRPPSRRSRSRRPWACRCRTSSSATVPDISAGP